MSRFAKYIIPGLIAGMLAKVLYERTAARNAELSQLQTDIAAKRACELLSTCQHTASQLDPYQLILLSIACGFVVSVAILYVVPRIKAYADMWLDAKIQDQIDNMISK